MNIDFWHAHHVRVLGRSLAGLVLFLTMVFSSGGLAQGWPLVVCAASDNLPYSKRGGDGFENAIAEILASELGATVEYLWIDSPFSTNYRVLLEQGDCDMLMAAADGQHGVETSLAYYRASYMFIQRSDASEIVSSLDDPAIRDMRIGVLIPDGGGISPPAQALVFRDLVRNQVTFVASRQSSEPVRALLGAIQSGEVDVAIAWGPLVGYFVSQQDPAEAFLLRPVEPQFDINFTPMVIPISVAFRRGEIELRDLVSEAIVARWDDVRHTLDSFGVPTLELPRPTGGGAQ